MSTITPTRRARDITHDIVRLSVIEAFEKSMIAVSNDFYKSTNGGSADELGLFDSVFCGIQNAVSAALDDIRKTRPKPTNGQDNWPNNKL